MTVGITITISTNPPSQQSLKLALTGLVKPCLKKQLNHFKRSLSVNTCKTLTGMGIKVFRKRRLALFMLECIELQKFEVTKMVNLCGKSCDMILQ